MPRTQRLTIVMLRLLPACVGWEDGKEPVSAHTSHNQAAYTDGSGHAASRCEGGQGVSQGVASTQQKKGRQMVAQQARASGPGTRRAILPAAPEIPHRATIADHHHLTSALFRQGITHCYCQVVSDQSALGWEQFWEYMEGQHYVWPYSSDGTPLSLQEFVAHLPSDVRGLKDDPYRSLAALVRGEGGYEK
ncbi:uncharacterized protein HaLaN_25135, partial [Haematococcus lacustris]